MSKSDDVVYILRTCAADMSGYGGFKWPERGTVRCPAPDPTAVPGTNRSLRHWDPTPQCGNGLHGLLFGEGEVSHLSTAKDAKWLVVKVKRKNVVDLNDKVKFKSGVVVFCGSRDAATAPLRPGTAAPLRPGTAAPSR